MERAQETWQSIAELLDDARKVYEKMAKMHEERQGAQEEKREEGG